MIAKAAKNRSVIASVSRDELVAAFPFPDPWEHQVRGLLELYGLMGKHQAICLTAPTGGGKTVMMAVSAILAARRQAKVVVYTNRRMLTKQMFKAFDDFGLAHGVRSAAFKDREDMHKLVQVSSIATEVQRVFNQQQWDLHDADIVFVDEAHMQANGRCLEVIESHLKDGAIVVGWTATPIDISHLYKRIVVAGTKSELRKCGAHVKAIVKACSEIDTTKIEKTLLSRSEFGEEDIRECWGQAIVGRVYEEWKKYNPDARQTLCFAPGVPESVWLAKEFASHGVSVAHIDAKDVWVDGEVHKDSADGKVRSQVLDDWDHGYIKCVFNCQVMTEGIDRPSIYHGILARPYGSLKNYVQAVGRIIRRSEATPSEVLITDHGASFYRHGKYGSPNCDIDWNELFWLSEAVIRKRVQRERLENPEKEPISCPECGTFRSGGSQCPICGYKHDKRTRRLVQRTGEIIEVEGMGLAPKPADENLIAQKRWDRLYWAVRNKKDSKLTFRQMCGIFQKTHGSKPPLSLKRMPRDEFDWQRRVCDVKWSELIS